MSLASCGVLEKPDWSKVAEPDGKKRAQQNVRDGKGIKWMGSKNKGGGNFLFASSNPMWRASLETLDFLPLATVDYSGGIIITDWYSNERNQNESIKISIRFLTNEIRSDALNIKVFTRKCETSLLNCKFIDSNDVLVAELKKEILKKAAIYKKQNLKKPKNNAFTGKP